MGKEIEAINVSKAATTTNMFYLFLHGGKAAVVPFLTLFFRLIGLSAFEAGCLIAAKTVTGLVWAPLWARCAMVYSRHRTVLSFSLFMMMATYLCFPALYTQLATPEHCPLEMNGTYNDSSHLSDNLQQSDNYNTMPTPVEEIQSSTTMTTFLSTSPESNKDSTENPFISTFPPTQNPVASTAETVTTISTSSVPIPTTPSSNSTPGLNDYEDGSEKLIEMMDYIAKEANITLDKFSLLSNEELKELVVTVLDDEDSKLSDEQVDALVDLLKNGNKKSKVIYSF